MDYLDFLHDLLPESWFSNIQEYFSVDLTDEVIAQSVQEASDFFNMNAPMITHEDWTTGVMTGLSFTESDDILIFNRDQLLTMGITDKEGFDLVMTHEGGHRALQNLDTGFTSHQEELCCDYLAGVRAGLNGMNEGKMMASLAGTPETDTHPDGMIRISAIEAGVTFAHDYLEEHDGVPPTFSDCMAGFENSEVFKGSDSTEYTKQVNLSQEHVNQHNDNTHETSTEVKEYTQTDVEWYERQARISSGSEQAHWLKEAQWARDHIKGFNDSENPEGSTLHEFHGGRFGNATGDYIDDSYDPETHKGTLKGLFVDNRSYHLREAQDAKETAEWHHKRANAAIARGDLSAARDHNSRAELYEKSHRDHLKSASKCTK